MLGPLHDYYSDKMDMEDIKVVLMRVLEDGVVDLTEVDSVQAGIAV
jgi:hypothetical protein